MVQDTSAQGIDDSVDKALDKSSFVSDIARPPTVLQVLPELVTGGVERGTVEIAGAIVEGGGRAVVASAGGPTRIRPAPAQRSANSGFSDRNP